MNATLADNQWHRAKPLSIVVDGWIAIVALLGYLITQIPQWDNEDFSVTDILQRYPLISLAVIFFFLSPALSWYSTHFKIDDEYVRVRTGILHKKQNQARINRIQSVDVVQPFVARLLGLARLEFDVADSGASMLVVRYVSKADAVALRAELLVRAGRAENPEALQDGDEPVAETPRTELARHSPGLVALLTVGSPEIIIFTIASVSAGFTAWVSPLVRDMNLFLGLVPMAMAAATMVIPRLNRYANFVLSWEGDGLRLSSGLTSTMDQTLPAGRIQGVEIKQNILLRMFGRYQLNVNVAGFATDAANATASLHRATVLPAGTWAQVQRVLPLVLPDIEDAKIAPISNDLMHQLPALQLAEPGTRAFVFAPFAHRRLGAGIIGGMFVARDGWLTRTAHLVSLNRLQGLFVKQGPLQRLAGTCTLRADIPLGVVRPTARHLPVEAAAGIMAHALQTANFARRYTDRQQWMGERELAEFNRRTEELVNEP